MLFPIQFTEYVTNKSSMLNLMEGVSISVMQNMSVSCCVCNTLIKDTTRVGVKYSSSCTQVHQLLTHRAGLQVQCIMLHQVFKYIKY